MNKLMLSFKILLKDTQPLPKAQEATTHLVYLSSLFTLGISGSFGFGILFALRFFGPDAFSSYYLLSWLLLLAIIPKALAQHLQTPRWRMYTSLPISITTWKWAQLLLFSLVYGYALFLPIIFGLIWGLLFQSFTIFFAMTGIWLMIFSLILRLSITPPRIFSHRAFQLIRTFSFWLLVGFNFFASLNPTLWQFFSWLQAWLHPRFQSSHRLIFGIGFLSLIITFRSWKLTTATQLSQQPVKHTQRPLWAWLWRTLRTPNFLSQWLTNLWLLLLAGIFITWQIADYLSPLQLISFLTGFSFSCFALFSPAWCLYSLISSELPLLKALPFDWRQDYWQRGMVLIALQLSQLFLFSLVLLFILPYQLVLVSSGFTLLLLIGQTFQALSTDLAQPHANWQSVVQLLRPTWIRLKKTGFTLITILIIIGVASSMRQSPLSLIFSSIFLVSSWQSFRAVQQRKGIVNQ
ncbi:MAG: hypothetical protein ACRC17_07335 [Culicoidibacterales bacterium]